MRISNSRGVKEALLDKIVEKVPFENVKEWLWEDFGVSVKSWEDAKRFIMREEVTIGDLIALLRDEEIEIDEASLDV